MFLFLVNIHMKGHMTKYIESILGLVIMIFFILYFVFWGWKVGVIAIVITLLASNFILHPLAIMVVRKIYKM
jgi:hypothetical protein